MTTLPDFLLARIAEDEARAREAGDRGRHWFVPADSWGSGAVEASDFTDNAIVVYDEGRPDVDQAAHIARWDPARVLAECEAKRRIVTEHPAEWNEAWQVWHCPTCSDSSYTDWAKPTWPCATLRALALPYADHPDYREEWRP